MAAVPQFGGYFRGLPRDRSRSVWPLVTDLDENNFRDFISTNGIAVVDFYSNWCPPCRLMDPIFRSLSSDFGGSVGFGKLNISKVSDIPEVYGIRRIPTLIFFREGEEVDRMVGVRPKRKVSERVKSLMEQDCPNLDAVGRVDQ